MWPVDRYVTLLMGEVPRLTDDANGYGPAGRGYTAHVDVPPQVRRAYTHLRETTDFATRAADPRWAGLPCRAAEGPGYRRHVGRSTTRRRE
jgi:hypothetical protein